MIRAGNGSVGGAWTRSASGGGLAAAVLGGLAAVAMAIAIAAIAAPTAQAADDCPNAEFRTGFGAHLPDCRAYEMVSPADKSASQLLLQMGGGTVAYPSPTGDQAYFNAVTPFADPKSGRPGFYVAERTGSGWTTRNLVPADCAPNQVGLDTGLALVAFAKDDFSKAIMYERSENCFAPGDEAGVDLYTVAHDGSLTWISQNGEPKTADVDAGFAGTSADGLHVLFTTSEQLVLPLEAGRTGNGLYDRTGGRTVPVGLKDDGSLINPCGAVIAGASGGPFGGAMPAVSADGRAIFFQSGTSPFTPGCSTATDDAGQLYARIDAERTIELSESQRDVPDPAGRKVPAALTATKDGTKIFFTSTEMLTDDATTGGGLYEYDLSEVLEDGAATGTLSFLSPSVDGNPAAIRALAGISDDGNVVYFTANGVLDDGATAGALNVYRVEGGEVTHVTTPPSIALFASDTSVSADGSKLAIVAPSDGVDQVHLYDSRGSGEGICVSCPTDGSAPTGDALITKGGRSGYLAPMRFVTNDGRVFFNSPDRLASGDGNDRYDVYEYDAGDQRLISSGAGPYDSPLLGTSPGGRDLFFGTSDSLVDADFDNGDIDLYTARIGGGFPSPPATERPCAGDGCQPATPVPPAFRAPGSLELNGRGNVRQGKRSRVSRPKVSLLRHKRRVRGVSTRVRVRVFGRGSIRVGGRGVARSRRPVQRRGVYRVRVRLSKRARRILRRERHVTVRVVVRFRPAQGRARSARTRLTFRLGARKRKAHARSRRARYRASVTEGGR